MFKRKIMLGTTAGLISALAIAGAAFAQDRVDGISGIDRETLDSAMSTAREENREAKQDERLAALQESSGDGENPHDSIQDRVAEILGIDRETLDSAMSTAREENREAKQDERLAALVEDGTITQDQAYKIDAWEDSKPKIMGDLKKLGREYGGVKGDLAATLASLVEQEVTTQAEADAFIAWLEAKPDYLDDLREEMRPDKGGDGERDSRRGRHPLSRHHRGGPGQGCDHGGPDGSSFQKQAPESGEGATFILPNGSEISF